MKVELIEVISVLVRFVVIVTCICTSVGGCLRRGPEMESDMPLTESIPSGGVIGLQKEEMLETGAE